jgi:flagellar hook-associated protein 1 FlgK
MDLSISLQNALSGLQAAQASLSIVASNISNAQTPGYSQESAALSTEVVGGRSAGVLVGVTQRDVNNALNSAAREQDTTASGASTTNGYYQQIQNLFGQVNGSESLNSVFSNFSGAMQTLATTPQDPVAQQAAVSSGQALAQSLNNLSSGIQQVRSNADNEIASDVATVNQALQNIANFNTQIEHLQADGQSTAALEDQRDQALGQVSKMMSVQSFTRPNGGMVVLTTSGQVLVDTNVGQLNYTPAGTVTATSQLSAITLNGANITSGITSGSLGALLTMRDQTLPNLTAQLNQFTNSLFGATQSASLATTNSGLGATNDANHFFADVDTSNGLDNAATIQVNPSLVANPGLLNGPANNPNPAISQAMAQNLTSVQNFAGAGGLPASSTTLSAYASQIIGQLGNAASNASENNTFQSSLQTQLAAQASTANGVNLDQQLEQLMSFQNMYAASAHVISTVDAMFTTLFQIQ